MIIKRLFAVLFAVAAVCSCTSSSRNSRWSEEKAWKWYSERDWPVGCDYIPAYAGNQLEKWQEDTFSPDSIDRELGWAQELGFNTLRVFLHHVLWQSDKEEHT